MTQVETDPLATFRTWFEEARTSEPELPEAMTLATATSDGRPSARMVLLKEADARGFVFYTNLESRKGGELAANPRAALLFHWKSLNRQVRIEGDIVAVEAAEADAYFASRAREARLGAWASAQSRPMEGRFELEKRVAQMALRFPLGEVPRPDFWSGLRLVPERYEFWRERAFRLHERIEYAREDGTWRTQALFP